MAKRQGVYAGGKRRLDRVRVKELSNQGLGPAAIAREFAMARSLVYRLLEMAGTQARSTASSVSLASSTTIAVQRLTECESLAEVVYLVPQNGAGSCRHPHASLLQQNFPTHVAKEEAELLLASRMPATVPRSQT